MDNRLLLGVGVKNLRRAGELIGHLVDGFEVAGGRLPGEQASQWGPVVSWHLPFMWDADEAVALALRVHRSLAVTRFVFHPQGGEDADHRTRTFATCFAAGVGPEVQGFVEIMGQSSYPAPGALAYMVRNLRQAAGLANLGVCLDTSHVLPPERLPRLIEQLGDTLGHVHLSDVKRRPNGSWLRHQFPGEGSIDWKGTLASIRPYLNGPLVVEPHTDRGEAWPERVERSFEFLHEILARL